MLKYPLNKNLEKIDWCSDLWCMAPIKPYSLSGIYSGREHQEALFQTGKTLGAFGRSSSEKEGSREITQHYNCIIKWNSDS